MNITFVFIKAAVHLRVWVWFIFVSVIEFARCVRRFVRKVVGEKKEARVSGLWRSARAQCVWPPPPDPGGRGASVRTAAAWIWPPPNSAAAAPRRRQAYIDPLARRPVTRRARRARIAGTAPANGRHPTKDTIYLLHSLNNTCVTFGSVRYVIISFLIHIITYNHSYVLLLLYILH